MLKKRLVLRVETDHSLSLHPNTIHLSTFSLAQLVTSRSAETLYFGSMFRIFNWLYCCSSYNFMYDVYYHIVRLFCVHSSSGHIILQPYLVNLSTLQWRMNKRETQPDKFQKLLNCVWITLEQLVWMLRGYFGWYFFHSDSYT